jgi:N-acetylglucosaminyldiphosphoundecaprenol N-acetyl-beta-D-mannosaminyltransferase
VTICDQAVLDVLGVSVTACNTATAIEDISRWVREAYRSYATLTGVHGIMESVRDENVRVAHAMAGLVLPDGMPLVWLLWRAGFRLADRVYGPDLMLGLFRHSENTGHRHFLYGSTPLVLGRLKRNLERRFPAARIVGAHAPPFRQVGEAEEETVIAAINAAAPDIIWVGLSTPKQEVWMARHRSRLTAPALIGVGAAFDFHAGLTPQAPRVLQRMGLEWAFRLANEPRRLSGRYLRNNPAFVALLGAEKLGLRRSKQTVRTKE